MPKRTQHKVSLTFPIKGLDENWALKGQPRHTSADVLNVRSYSPFSGRARGAQRPGLAKFVNDRTANGFVQDVTHIITAQDVATSQSAFNTRTITALAVTDGTIERFSSDTFTAVTGGASALDANAPQIFSADLFGKVYYVDGTNYVVYDVATDTASTWTATAGTLPADSGNTSRLITVWNGRIVLSGIASDPENWFMSAVGDALDWDIAPTNPTSQTAISGNNAPTGKVADVINGLIPYNDDILIFLCDHSIYQMTGDPYYGGRIDRLSDSIGGAWGRAWCKDDNGVIYFFGSRGGVYRMVPGAPPQSISEHKIEERLSLVNLNSTSVRMAWNDQEKGVHLFLTRLNGSRSTHYFWDRRNEAWFRDTFGNALHSPISVHALDGDKPDDRRVILGCQDGYIRIFSNDAVNDDGEAILSGVFFGPILLEQGTQPFVLRELQCVLSAASADVQYDVLVGASVNQAFYEGNDQIDTLLLADGNTFVYSERPTDSQGEFSAIRSKSVNPRLRGYAAFIRISNDNLNDFWEFESLTAFLSVPNRSKRRIWSD